MPFYLSYLSTCTAVKEAGLPDMSTCPTFPVDRFGKGLALSIRQVSEKNPDHMFLVIQAPEKRVLANFYAPSDADYPVIVFQRGQEQRSRIQRGDTLDTMSFLPEELRAAFRTVNIYRKHKLIT